MQSASEAVHRVLGTDMPLSQITEVRMHVAGRCKMGISFWPSFRFTQSPDKPAEPGSVKLIYAPSTASAASAAGGPPQQQQQQQQQSVGTPATAPPASPATAEAEALVGAPAGSRPLLHISFTKDPPDEFKVGAKSVLGLPFPFITIRTHKLEGTLDPETGAVTLLFEAVFLAQVGKREPTSLSINATLTAEPAHAFKKSMQGKRLEGGHGVLVSAAEVPKTPSWFANFILWLPTAATAKLPVRFEFS